MRRYLCLYFPEWSTELAKREHGEISSKRPVLLTTDRAGQSTIQAFSPEAGRAGIEEGISTSLAKALLPEAVIHPASSMRDFKFLYKIAVWCIRFTPLVALEKEVIQGYREKRLELVSPLHHGVILDTTGTERIHGGERSLLERILSGLSRAQLTVSIGVASTPGTAWALSRYGRFAEKKNTSRITAENNIAFLSTGQGKQLLQILAELPPAALRISAKTAEQLEELGVYSIADLIALPRKKLLPRFGVQLINRLNQALGKAEETLHLIHPKEHIVSRKSFDPPLRIKLAVQKALLELLLEVFGKLSSQQRQAGKFILTLQGRDPNRCIEESFFLLRKEFSLHAASKNPVHISSIIEPFFDSLHIPEGVSDITLAAEATERIVAGQEECFVSSLAKAPQQLSDEFLNTLILQLGNRAVRKLSLHDSYVPEKAFSYITADEEKGTEQKTERQHRRFRYPPKVFEHPERITAIALLPDAPPTRLHWKGSPLNITRGFGPERICNEWWKLCVTSLPEEREYFRLQDHTGRWLWVFRKRQSMEWYLHGIWA